ncbi:MAG: ABC transporter permease [Actinomycetota bacterium]|nr:ABC transporter permease [Actinomycetota bacterium]
MSIADSGSDLTIAEGLDDVASPGGQRFWIGVRQVLVAAFLLVVAGALWELAKLVTGTGDRTMPHVWDTLRFLGSTTSQNENYTWFLIQNAWSTAKASLVGLLVGTAFGLTTGISIARSKFVGNGLMPLIVAAQAVPIVAIAPALVLWLGTGGVTKTVITTYLTFFPVTVATARGIQSVPQESHELLRTYGASKRTSLRILEVPFASPLIFVGLETAAAFSVVGAIVAELPFGSNEGLGVVILTSWQFYITEPRALYCVALASCVLGATFVLSVRLLAYFALGPRSQGEVL